MSATAFNKMRRLAVLKPEGSMIEGYFPAEDLQNYSDLDLKKLARTMGLKAPAKLTREDLIQLISATPVNIETSEILGEK